MEKKVTNFLKKIWSWFHKNYSNSDVKNFSSHFDQKLISTLAKLLSRIILKNYSPFSRISLKNIWKIMKLTLPTTNVNVSKINVFNFLKTYWKFCWSSLLTLFQLANQIYTILNCCDCLHQIGEHSIVWLSTWCDFRILI